ncbi:MAG: hypothetical protein UR25_C0003G0010 [Candidatus Nomurabacteria bacterium GW2011_GWE1_32_28]|uniref:Uncharacterized protein n=1 Tax=Candidatus Nomurabacteria bacterium GW2011_GWF1_31_48 TaxID=1618767 RepID=A0A0G0BGQ5_9BACT|nr:MAG: hypothetical protein UR10_C0003G0010 [Candidatus Nomurabacteria bacterium GW2011_GWF2_30_133]KKP28650.1 MAG: hypothetical protein UR18_C0002G0062 [Candidatus Nomurabacteria bacterium GW2011_GWE2_31_40]KKP30227.1 MAG: hypothetical protein UR19_C0003G0063 [Candidatus Nomurabacteria bacterium GW2011_GWF1_31_48]KKP34754.1 MAG: hypothetical protein UR25_C0003G0010 [Candidatus Nomurabacteria bacterium GW2011_GWE1_32_28]HAS80788.1 hypothetical protein [Candidatus Nomurabacteria bacterium]
MKIFIRNNLYRSKKFWLTKKWFEEKPIFSFWAKIFKLDFNINKGKYSARLLWPSIFPFIRTLIYSVFIIAIFETYSYFFPVDQKIFSDQVTDTLLSAIASVSGVFLGLYFTAVSGIASNFLLRATQNIRRYFLSTPIGEQYVKTVALTGIISIFYLLAKSFGHPIHPVGLVFLCIGGAYIIIRFWSVGSNVFYSLEPTVALPSIGKNIADLLRGVTPPGFKWDKPAIQNHQRRLVSDNLELAKDLINFGIKEIKLSNEQLHIALRYLGGLLFLYPQYKKKIPTNSFWFKTKNQYDSWTLADSTQIALALNTGTSLQPKTIKDFTWFEEETLDMSVNIFEFYAKEKNVASVFQGLELFVEIAEVYANDFDEEGLKLLLQKTEKVAGLIDLEKVADPKNVRYKEQMAFIDTQGRLAIGAVLGLARYLDTASAESLSTTISNIKWYSNRDIYLTGLPLSVLSRLESTASDLKAEMLIEGKQLSPEWYIRTLCVQKYLFALLGYFKYLKTLHSTYFEPKLGKLLAEDQLGLAVQLVQRWIEFTHKYNRLVGLIAKHIEDCVPYHQVKDLSWIEFSADEEYKTARDREKEVTDKMIRLLPRLMTMPTESDMPDYFGQALTQGVQACYEACEENDPVRLKAIFPVVFIASLSAFDMTRVRVQNWSEEQSKIIYSTEPLINLYELSGFAKLYSELYQNTELWNVVQTPWDTYLGGIDAVQEITRIAAITNYRRGLFMIMPQATLRTNWQMRFSNKMREQGLAVFPDSRSYDYVNGREDPAHASAVIRVVTRSGGLSLSTGQTVFFVTYLSQHPGATGIDLPDQRDMREQIQREEERSNEEENNDYE